MHRIHRMVLGIALGALISTPALAQDEPQTGKIVSDGNGGYTIKLDPPSSKARKIDAVWERAMQDMAISESDQTNKLISLKQAHVKHIQALQDSLGAEAANETGRRRLIGAYQQRFAQLRAIFTPEQQAIFDKNVKAIEQSGFKGPLGIQKP